MTKRIVPPPSSSPPYRNPHDEYVFSDPLTTLDAVQGIWSAKGYTRNEIMRLYYAEGWKTERIRYRKELHEKQASALIESQVERKVDDLGKVLAGARAGLVVFNSALAYHARRIMEERDRTGKETNPLGLTPKEAVRGLAVCADVVMGVLGVSQGAAGAAVGGSYDELLTKALDRMKGVEVELRVRGRLKGEPVAGNSGGNGNGHAEQPQEAVKDVSNTVQCESGDLPDPKDIDKALRDQRAGFGDQKDLLA